MEIFSRCLTLNEFRDYVKDYNFGSRPANKLVIHHTWKPTKESWAGERSILGLKRYYEAKGWKAGPHLFIAEDGIWLFSPMRKDGIHAGRLNFQSIGIEIVGNYNEDLWSGDTKKNAVGAIKTLLEQLDLIEKDIHFHRDASSKSCPGWAITKEWLFKELKEFRFPSIGGSAYGGKPRIPERRSWDNVLRNTTAPIPVDHYASEDMVLIPVPDWAKEAVDFVATHKLFKIKKAEDVRDAVKFYRFYLLIRQLDGQG